jgi:uridine kinase
MKNLPNFKEFLNEDEKLLNEGVASLDSYYKNAEKSVRDSAKKIDAILNKEIKSDATKKELLDLITDMVEEYAVEYADNRDQERY